MKESTVFVLDASPSMNSPIPATDAIKDSHDAATTTSSRLVCAKNAIASFLREYIEPSSDSTVNVLVLNARGGTSSKSAQENSSSNIVRLSRGGLARPTPQLISRIRYVESATTEDEKKMKEDICQGILAAIDLLEEQSRQQENDELQRRRIVVISDAGQEILLELNQILVAVDRLRCIQCRLEVIGLGFSRSASYEHPQSAESARTSDGHQQHQETSESSGTDEDESDETPEGYARYASKDDKEALLLSLVEKTGGSVAAVSSMKEILEAGKSIFERPAQKQGEGVIDLTDMPKPHKLRRLNPQSEWACTKCTLVNDAGAETCNACGSVQEVSKPSSSVAPTIVETKNNAVVSAMNAGQMPPQLPSRVTVLSFNVAGFISSSAAPHGWDPMPAFAAEIVKHSPDVICLQEVPSGREQFLFEKGYFCVGTRPSHCHNVALLLKREWASHATTLRGFQSPTVLASVQFASSKSMIFGSCHLEAFREGASDRLGQMNAALRAVQGNESPLIIAGDYNMRQNEDVVFEELGVRDAWKEMGQVYSEKFTWDSREGTLASGLQNRYHGPDAFQYCTRYDRIYFRGSQLSTETFNLIANKPLTNPFHFLSDHFGMVATFKVAD